MDELIRRIPKAELHLHIEGTLEPAHMFELARRNSYELPFETVDEVKAAYEFSDLQSFLDIYYQGAAVLQTRQDFYELMKSYLDRAVSDGVRRAEIFFDPQTHTERGIGYEVFMGGFRDAIREAESSHHLTADLILCFLRHLSGEDAVATLREAEPHLEKVIAVGLDSSERDRPPQLFVDAYDRARRLGLRAVAHAGEEGPAGYVAGALDDLGVERVDHGVRSLEDPELVARLVRDRVPLTVCPLSNVALRVVDELEEHPLPEMLDAGLMVSVNSDDPAYFGGYLGENYAGVARMGIGTAGMVSLARNSIESSFLAQTEKKSLLVEIDEMIA